MAFVINIHAKFSSVKLISQFPCLLIQQVNLVADHEDTIKDDMGGRCQSLLSVWDMWVM